jgi:hypothetical protein
MQRLTLYDPRINKNDKIIAFLVGSGSDVSALIKIQKSSFSDETLTAFKAESVDLQIEHEEEVICIPSIEPELFFHLKQWVDQGAFEITDPVPYNPRFHVSTWCRLHVLAKRFRIENLAEACLRQYCNCRQPHWQGGWMPLPAEVDFAYETPQQTSSLREVLVRFMIKQPLSYDRPANFNELAALAMRSKLFMTEIFRAFRSHAFEWEWTPNGCDIDNCRLHPRWIDPNAVVQVPLSRYGESEGSGSSTEVHEIIITSEDEEALAEAEVEEALVEADEVKEQLRREGGI